MGILPPLFSNSFSLIPLDNDNNTIHICLPTMLYSTEGLNFLALYELLTRPKLPFVALLTLESPRRRDRRIPRASLQDHSKSAFKCLFHSGNAQSLLSWPCLFLDSTWTLWACLWLTFSKWEYRIHTTYSYHTLKLGWGTQKGVLREILCCLCLFDIA
jgi:hypothetical protein